MTNNIHYFVVAASLDDTGKPTFIVDDEVFMARFTEGGVWDEEAQEWKYPDDSVADSALAEALADQLGKE